MARPKKDAPIDYSAAHDLSMGLIERATCPPGVAFVLLKDLHRKGLRVRITCAGGRHWQFETRVKGKLFSRTLGEWPTITIFAARDEALRLRSMTEKGIDPREVEQAESHRIEAAREADRQQELEKARVAAELQKYTLENLLTDYADHLEALGRKSHKDARSIFKLHVIEAWPEVAALPAQRVTMEQVADMMRRTLELGKGRTANKLRSYVRAAYQTAKSSRSKASIPVKFKAYSITSNPAADTSPDEASNKPDKRPLSPDDMRAYWRAIRDVEGFKGAALRLHLLTGGQRIEQLVNLLTADVAPAAITLFDSKGRPGSAPRPHTIPLTTQAAAALKQCGPAGKFALSTDGGKTHLGAITLSAWAVEVVGDLIPDFQTKRLRSGVETLLAGARISSEIRGRLQSHGVAGVQARHYDGHDYMGEKLEALKKLHQLLLPLKGSKVVEFKRA